MRRKIENEKLKISDKELFGSPMFAGYLTDLAEVAARRFRRPIRVKVYWDASATAEVAHTDNKKIVVNSGNFVTRSLPTKKLRAESLFGITGHEIGHVLFSDFTQLRIYADALLAGRMYPQFPEDLDFSDELALQELQKLLDAKDEVAIKVTLKAASELNNILEDNYIEAKICEAFPGVFRTGIQLVNIQFAEMAPPIQKQIDHGSHPYAIAVNLILQYCRMGDINNLGGYKGEYLDVVDQCAPIIDEAIVADTKDRFDGANRLLLKLWKYVKAMMDWVRDEMKRTGKSADEVLGLLDQELDKQIVKGSPSPTGGGRPAPGANKVIPDPSGLKEERGELQEVMAEESGRIALTKTDEISDDGDGGVVLNNTYNSVGYSRAAEDVSRMLNTLAEERVQHQLEEDLSDELQMEADKVRLGNAHRGVKLIINRMTEVDHDLEKQYQEVAPPLLQLSKRLQQQVAQHLMDEQSGGKLTGQFMGRHLETRKLYRDDGRFFYSNKLPKEEMNLAIALLNDESGSMGGCDRATTARATSIVLYDFCHALGIPIMIYGHTDTMDDDVDLFAYAEFDSYDQKDKFRLMDISSRYGNRDGAALRFVAERLAQRPEETKILILISDGQPASAGYYGTEAEADLRGIKKEYSNRGITFFAAAIGSDKPNIQRIYGDGFLDVTDLSKLPINLTRLISRYVRM